MNGSFYEQLGGVAGVFEQWGACERTVVACVLARRVPWPGLKLLQRAVEAALAHHNTLEDERLEREANDETYLAGLLAPRPDDDDDDGDKRLLKVVSLVPLLRADNERGVEALVRGAGGLLARAADRPAGPARALARHLLCYLLVHPATTDQHHRTLTQWLRYLENMTGNRTPEAVWQQRIEPCLLPETNIWGSGDPFRRTIGKNVEFRSVIDPVEHFTADFLQESFSKNGRDVDISGDSERLLFDAAVAQPKTRSNSLTPPSASFLQASSSAENLSDESFVLKPRSFSLSSEHGAALRPLGAASASETRLDQLRSHRSPHPGMASVAHWLKTLRLHKYVWLFTNITYEQMMAIDENYLEKLGVTKGARHKILLSIKKLNERESVVESVEAELQRALAVGAGAAAGGAVSRALERLRGVLLAPLAGGALAAALVRALTLASKALALAPDALSLHCWLVERALHHEAFARPDLLDALRRLRHRLPPRQFFHHVGDMPMHRRCPKPRWRGPPVAQHKARRWSGGGAVGPALPRGKSHSYPPCPPPDDYSSLDALCLQMTEQAIN